MLNFVLNSPILSTVFGFLLPNIVFSPIIFKLTCSIFDN